MTTKNQSTIEKLNQLLADYHIYYQNLRGLHWNIKGNMFFALHNKFEEYYDEASEVIDEIAERILMLDGQPLHTLADYLKTARMEQLANVTRGKEAVEAVLENNRYLLQAFNDLLQTANENDDEGTAAMMSDWIGETEKRIWMLKSFLA